MHCRETNLRPAQVAEDYGSFHRAGWDIGATNAITARSGNTAGFTLTRSDVGTFALTFPTGKYGFPPIVRPVSASTAFTHRITAWSPTAGTATLVTLNASNQAADLAQGDSLHVMCFCNGSL